MKELMEATLGRIEQSLYYSRDRNEIGAYRCSTVKPGYYLYVVRCNNEDEVGKVSEYMYYLLADAIHTYFGGDTSKILEARERLNFVVLTSTDVEADVLAKVTKCYETMERYQKSGVCIAFHRFD